MKIFNLNLVSENLEILSAYVAKITERFKKIEGLADIDSNFRTGKPEFHIDFDRPKSEALVCRQ